MYDAFVDEIELLGALGSFGYTPEKFSKGHMWLKDENGKGGLHVELKVHEQLKLGLCFRMKEFSAEKFDPVWAHNFVECQAQLVIEKKNVS